LTLRRRIRSIHHYLLAGIIIPIAVFALIDALSLYNNALKSANTAYDRMLVASTHAIGDLLRIESNQIVVTLPHAVLEVFEADHSNQMVYRVSGPRGEFISGYEDLPCCRDPGQSRAIYPALVEFYEDTYRGDPVRVAVLRQPVASNADRGYAVVQVAETTSSRQIVAKQILRDTLLRQVMLLAIVTMVTAFVVSRALGPLRALRGELECRRADDLSAISVADVPREISPVVQAINELMQRLQGVLDYRRRFIANASHQLRTPLAVLTTQVQSGLRGDAEPKLILSEISRTIEHANILTEKMLSLARVEQLRDHTASQPCDLAASARDVAVELSPLISAKNLDFELDVSCALIDAHPWMAEELLSNLLHNAIRYAPANSKLGIRIQQEGNQIAVCVWDCGPGLRALMQERLFEPFSTSSEGQGTGLGLTICRDIVDSLHGAIRLSNRVSGDHIEGLDACVTLPASPND
jgi:two-component system, OmpR family, sensor histidine kinase TctE